MRGNNAWVSMNGEQVVQSLDDKKSEEVENRRASNFLLKFLCVLH